MYSFKSKLLFVTLCALLAGCQQRQEDFSESPFLTPEESLKKIAVEQGFTVELVAAEPLVNSPVALQFDELGRMWVVEMQSYMLDTVGTGEDEPAGQIVVLEDTDKDGVYDQRQVFLDSLVMPRAICLIEDGILVAEPPKLWFVEIRNGQAGKKTLVDSAYAEGGNVEHQPNGLLRAMDNWIYSAKSDKRYRRKEGGWLTERTHLRGQWGITQDDYGRLYYNTNSQNLLGDFFGPGLGAYNPNQRRVAGYDEKIVQDKRVYPARPTPGVNRGYMDGILDDSLRLVNFTAACGPLIYRGALFGPDYVFNAFVPEPSANLIKRNILSEDGFFVTGRQAYQGREFLTSTDERFRPVNLHNGPDGAMYIVDMYRGLLEHKTYLTEYLREEVKARGLDQPNTSGRIYRVFPGKERSRAVSFPDNYAGLVELLRHPNGWIRDKSQQLLIDHRMVEAVELLRKMLKDTGAEVSRIHALWVLEGLGELRDADLEPLLKDESWHIRMQAMQCMPSLLTRETSSHYAAVIESGLTDSLTAPLAGFLANRLAAFDKAAADRIVNRLIALYPANRFVADAVISNRANQEEVLLRQLQRAKADTASVVYKRVVEVLTQIREAGSEKKTKQAERDYPKGATLFRATCAPCHGPDGNGVKSLAPPLNHSEWVTGSKDRLIAVILVGLTGPIEVGGKLYQTPEVSGEMPGLIHNDEYGDEDVAQVASFIRNAWSNTAPAISKEEVAKIREKYKDRRQLFTAEDFR